MHDSDSFDEFVSRLSAAQPGLYAFILSLVPNAHDARDVLAETNLAIWKKREEYDSSKVFWPWACRFGKLQVLAYRKRMLRDRLVFSEDVIRLLAVEAETVGASSENAVAALETCLDSVEDRRRKILQMRYRDGKSVKSIAQELDRSAGAIADLLYRLRLQLATCVEKKLVAME